jgi:hypothetical protein
MLSIHSMCWTVSNISPRYAYLAQLMPLKTITKLFQCFIPQTRMHDMPNITTITYGRGLNRPSGTRRVVQNPHGVGRTVQPRRKNTIPNPLTFESRAGTEEKPNADSQYVKAETLRRHTRRRVPTDRAKRLMNNGSWDAHLLRPSSKPKKARNRSAKLARKPNVRNSEDAGRMSNK